MKRKLLKHTSIVRWLMILSFCSMMNSAMAKEVLHIELKQGKILTLERPAKSIFVADPSIVDFQVKAADNIYFFSKALGSTTFYALDENDQEIVHYTIKVTPNLSQLRESLDALINNHKIEVGALGDSIVLKGSVSSPEAVEDARKIASKFVSDENKILNFLSIASPAQVNLKVMIVEMSRQVNRSIGLNWSALYQSTNSSVRLAEPFNVASIAGNAFTVNGVFNMGSFNINALIELLDEDGLVTVLSQPNLTALSGQTATFLAGGEFPVLIPGNDTPSIEFKQFGVSLSFTPTLLSGKNINLHVRPEVSQLSTAGAISFNGFSVPSLVTRRAETTVEIASGQSFAIAGLLESSATHDIDKFPGLGDVPVVGQLFKSEEFKRGETELVIIVTPYLVQPTDPKNLKLPTENLATYQKVSPFDFNRDKVGFIVK